MKKLFNTIAIFLVLCGTSSAQTYNFFQNPWVFAQSFTPTSGVAVTINGFTAQTSLVINASSGSAGQVTNGADVATNSINSSATTNRSAMVFRQANGARSFFGLDGTQAILTDSTNGDTAITNGTSGNIRFAVNTGVASGSQWIMNTNGGFFSVGQANEGAGTLDAAGLFVATVAVDTISGSQTLTNKTITAPTITAPTITGVTGINVSNNAATNIGTGTTTSTVTVGGGSDVVNVNATTASIIGSTLATMGSATSITLVGPVGINVSNGAVATNINTGTTTGTVTIGGGSDAVTLNANTLTLTGGTLVTSASPVTLSNATITLSGITTGTNADFLCRTSGGVVLIQTSSCTISSLRFKENVHDVDSSLPKIEQLKVASFNMKPMEYPNADPNFGSTQTGLIAENIARVAPECAIYENDLHTPKSYRQECVIALLVKGMQEQQREIVSLKRRRLHE